MNQTRVYMLRLIQDFVKHVRAIGVQTIIGSHNEIFIDNFRKYIKYIYPKSSMTSIVRDYKEFSNDDLSSNSV